MEYTYIKAINPSVAILLITALAALTALIFVIAAIIISENRLYGNDDENTGTTGSTGSTGGTGPIEIVCSGPGEIPLLPPPSYTRTSPRSSCQAALSNYVSPFTTVNHTVQKLNRLRSVNIPVSPNHWAGNTFFGDDNTFNCFPYNGRIENDRLEFSWPTSGALTMICDSDTCYPNSSDLMFNVNSGPKIKLGSSSNSSLSCDILDVDGLVTTVAWQYTNQGRMTVPLVKGSPYITAEINNLTVSLECDFLFTTQHTSVPNVYALSITDTEGYLLFMSESGTPVIIDNSIFISDYTGVIRIAYFDSQYNKKILMDNYAVYPIESTVSVSTQKSSQGNWSVDNIFTWTVKNIGNTRSKAPLMLALPHHNVINVIFESEFISHPLIGPYRFLMTGDNTWILGDAVADFGFNYNPINDRSLSQVWDTESVNISGFTPQNLVNWCKWLGSIATLALIGDMMNKDISRHLNLLRQNLSLVSNSTGNMGAFMDLVTDYTWGGIINKMGLNNCAGNSDDGNSFYENHIGQYGYLIFAYAVIGHFDKPFLNANKDIALLFARDVVNPYENDNTFPLWRNKDWYFGYSIVSGLSPLQTRGKKSSNSGEIIFGYYASYLLGSVLNHADLRDWSLAYLASEINSQQHYFQLVPLDKVTVNPAFEDVGTITERGDTYYDYTVGNGNLEFPARTASIMVPIVKPLSMMSFDYIGETWADYVNAFMDTALSDSNIQPESYAYGNALLSVNNSSGAEIVADIVANKDIYLPYGTTWSSVLYWVLKQSNMCSSNGTC